jgi:hypothetical protein
MRRTVPLTLVAVVVLAATAVDVNESDAIEWGRRLARTSSWADGGSSVPWHAGYAHAAYGAPVALVVPPTAGTQRDYSWGVPSSRRTQITPQFGRGNVPVGVEEAGGFRPTPRWPSDTNQIGVYYIRGPW